MSKLQVNTEYLGGPAVSLPVDFAQAAERHAQSARKILDSQPDDAAYLSGCAVECAFKTLLDCYTPKQLKDLGHDLAALSGNALEVALLLTPGIGRYRVDQHPDVRTIIDKPWEVAFRYTPDGYLPVAEATTFVQGAEIAVRDIVHALWLDGRR